MALPIRNRPRRPWIPWVKVGLVVGLVAGGIWGILELGQRYLGLQKLSIEQVSVSGCRGERLAEIQKLSEELTLGKPLFWFDAEGLRNAVESRRWVRGLLIRRDPPDRLSLVIEERKPLLWLVLPKGVFLLSDDGILLDRVNQGNLLPIPVVFGGGNLNDETLVELIRTASAIRDGQGAFYERMSELKWSEKGPVVYLEGLSAPIFLSRHDPVKNIPNFQGLFLDRYANRPEVQQIRYFDLRWDDEVAVGEAAESTPPKGR